MFYMSSKPGPNTILGHFSEGWISTYPLSVIPAPLHWGGLPRGDTSKLLRSSWKEMPTSTTRTRWGARAIQQLQRHRKGGRGLGFPTISVGGGASLLKNLPTSYICYAELCVIVDMAIIECVYAPAPPTLCSCNHRLINGYVISNYIFSVHLLKLSFMPLKYVLYTAWNIQ